MVFALFTNNAIIFFTEMANITSWLIGSSGGIGNALGKTLHNSSDFICACDIRENPSDTAHPKALWFRKTDCGDAVDFKTFADAAEQLHGAPRQMVVAAGYVSSLTLSATSPDEIDMIYRNNFKIVSLALQLFYEKADKDPRNSKNVVILASNAGLVPRPNQAVYGAMKSAIIALARSQAVAWGPFNFKINVLAPGSVAVERNIDSLKKSFPNFPNDRARPLGKIAFPEDLQSACALLLDENLLMTGAVLPVDAGSTL